jgi:drug/metabolite transporter (DMT)-like permease
MQPASTSSLPTDRHPLRGILYITAATFLWGVAASLGRAVFTGKLALAGQESHPIDALILAQTRTGVSLLVLMPLLLARRGAPALRLPRRDIVQVSLLGTLGVAASNYFYYLAIQRTSVAIAIIVQYSAPVWVLLYMVVRGHQHATWRRMSSVALAVLGSVLAIGVVGVDGLHLDGLGMAAALLAALSFSFYNISGHSLLGRYDRFQVLLWTLLSATVCWLFINPPWKIVGAHYSGGQWAFLVLFSLISVLVPFSCYFAGLQHLEPTSAIVASCMEPVFAIVIAAISLREGLRPVQVSGIVVVLVAIILIQLPEKAEPGTVVEPME